MISLKYVRAKLVGLVLGSIAALWGGASEAQSVVQPPVLQVIDQNGVNLATGLPSAPGINIGIGAGGSGLGRQSQSYRSAVYGIYNVDNFSGSWTSQFVVFTGDMAGPIGREMVLVSYGGATHQFVIGGGHQNSIQYVTPPYGEYGGGNSHLTCSGTGAQVQAMQGTCTLTLTDGTSVFYSAGLMQTITKPDGEVITVTSYGSGNKLVSSTLGWALNYSVDSNYELVGVTAVNTAVKPCTVTSCTPPSDAPSASMTVNGMTRTFALNGVTTGSYTLGSGTFTVSSPSGVTKTYTLITSGSDTGKVSSVSYAGQTWSYAYTTTGTVLLTTVTEPNGKTRQLASDTTNGTVSYQVDEAGRKTSYNYDSGSNRLIQVVNPDGSASTGGFTNYTYDTYGRLTETDVVPKGGATNGTINAGAAIVTRAQYSVTCDTTTFANAKYCNKPTSTTDANGVTTTYTYDSNSGEVATETLPAVNGVTPQTRYTYTPQTPYVMNASGALAAQPVVYRLTMTSSCMSSNWNSTTNACAGGATDERRITTAYTTSNVLPTSSTQSLGDGTLAQTTTTTYNNYGWILTTQGVKQTAADETYFFYDALGRRTGTVGVDPDGGQQRHRQASHTYYDADGHVSEIDTGIVGDGVTATYSGGDPTTRNGQANSDWQAMTSTSSLVQERNINEFDGYGRPIIAAHFIGNATTAKDVTQRAYDNMQRLSCEAVRLNSTDFANDYANLKSIGACALGTTGSDGSHDRITQYSYDFLGKVTGTTSAYLTGSARADFTKVYDDTSATGTATLVYAEDANGNRTSYSYDGFNRLIKTCFPLPGTTHSSSTTDCAQTAYRTTSIAGATQAGALVDYVTSRDGITNTNGYDVLGRVGKISSTNGGEGQSFTYDNFNEVLTHSTSTSGTTGTETYVYNALGWLQSDAQPVGTVSYAHDGYGRRSQLTYPGNFNITYGYDAADELTSLSENGNVSLVGFDYDDYGRRAHITRATSVTTTYGYDSSLRLGTLTQGASGASFYNQVTYGYNAADQIASKSGTNSFYDYHTAQAQTISYSSNGLNQIASVNSGPSFSYDGRGNLAGDGSGSTYSYNVDNLLTSATQSNVTSTLTYDPENRLYQISKNGSTTRFLYDGTDLIAEYDGNNNLLRRYVHGPADDEPLVWYEGSGTATKYYYGADDNGSINVITNSSGGQYAINTYDEYGLPGSGNTGRFQYTGQTWLSEIGMYYYKARFYNPAIGRFMQTDPIGYGDGMNWYAYVHNDPVDGSDASGLCGLGGGDCDDITTVIIHGCDRTCQGQREDSNTQFWNNAAYASHWVLGACSFAPSFIGSGCAAADGAVYLAQGRKVDAALSFGAAAVGLVSDAGGVKAAEEGAKLAVDAVKACGCFVGGTQVETPHGLVPIENVKVGDDVFAYDEKTGQIVSEAVTGLIRPEPKATYSLMFKGSHGETDVFRATADHPWFSIKHKWVHTSELKIGERIETATGQAFILVALTLSGKIEHTYNLEVQGLHTFLVGKDHLIVHNSFCAHTLAKAASKLDRNGLTKAGRALQKHSDRVGSVFAKITGRASAVNDAGQHVVEEILTSPGTKEVTNRFGGVDIIAADGRGVRYDGNNNFMGLLEP